MDNHFLVNETPLGLYEVVGFTGKDDRVTFKMRNETEAVLLANNINTHAYDWTVDRMPKQFAHDEKLLNELAAEYGERTRQGYVPAMLHDIMKTYAMQLLRRNA